MRFVRNDKGKSGIVMSTNRETSLYVNEWLQLVRLRKFQVISHFAAIIIQLITPHVLRSK